MHGVERNLNHRAAKYPYFVVTLMAGFANKAYSVDAELSYIAHPSLNASLRY